ncbi:PASTA domain-containing protein [Variovorax sp. E3]|uniref:PASTA domain-containing protein n=1 Tax=Variovorax sp. E3 TaxID=1914993 RepID=UPI0018DBB48A|nr:PASTA domain-containing protein [Variovorax sp. E3]
MLARLSELPKGLAISRCEVSRFFRDIEVPNVYSMPIDKARKALADKGWRPVRAKADGESRKAGFIKRGIVEIESCA